MRADRLVSILMLLQSRGKVTAGELAQTLGVSIRTIYRDMEALSFAGIPVYSERGPEGGCCLVEDYHTDLTGLTGEEAHALDLLTVPGPLDALEVGDPLRSALRKLFAALPGHLSVPPASLSIHLDWSAWGPNHPAGDALEKLYRAVCQHRKIQLIYRLDNHVLFQQKANALGLVAKAGAWYLVFQVGSRWQHKNVSRLEGVVLLDEPFTPPTGFNLKSYWEKVCAEREARTYQFKAAVLVPQPAVLAIQRHFGEAVTACKPETAPDGRACLEIGFEYLEEARSQLLGWGGAVEVIEPLGLRLSMADFARQALMQYEI
jgi:predicted DNA-binding transcriptional regulator YafY